MAAVISQNCSTPSFQAGRWCTFLAQINPRNTQRQYILLATELFNGNKWTGGVEVEERVSGERQVGG